MISTRILGRRTAPFPTFLITNRAPHGFTQDPSTNAHRRHTVQELLVTNAKYKGGISSFNMIYIQIIHCVFWYVKRVFYCILCTDP